MSGVTAFNERAMVLAMFCSSMSRVVRSLALPNREADMSPRQVGRPGGIWYSLLDSIESLHGGNTTAISRSDMSTLK
ncbi:hypothetical protein PHLCEN_2v10024 [Hermanssonia centrifuga]|uniref:Uncharacterized protein n=1 Tax=Hermanssonia centrifuga TaxID=98765 RepID=A0A2R6NP22_9APHY|nr:hypothetical protein PHLCEN_2v10024 [Hermanssonia centrifuga]